MTDLENCFAFGLSPIIALHEVLIARKLWLKVAEAEGRCIPAPSFRPIAQKFVSLNMKNPWSN